MRTLVHSMSVAVKTSSLPEDGVQSTKPDLVPAAKNLSVPVLSVLLLLQLPLACGSRRVAAK